jgi:glycosyltransferase involved in cell wall biosynthesis
MKVAIVCDWLTGLGGAEKVVLELHKLYPDAPIYTSQYDPSEVHGFEEADVRTTWLQTLPTGLKKFLPILRAWTFSRMDLSEYDLVLSSSGAEAKAVKTGPNTVHICYCHSPTQYYWNRHAQYLDRPGFPKGLNWLAKLGLKLLVGPLKRWDKKAAARPDYLIANSTHTQSMITKYYKRDSVIIFPPVDTERFNIKGTSPLRHGFVTAGRQTPYKRIDLAIAACNELKVPLVVIGDGPEHKALEKLGERSTTFLTNVTDGELPTHFQTAKAFILPTNVEDFGVVAVEAMAAGTPVIAYAKGGPEDYVTPGKTGLFFDKQTLGSLRNTLETALNKNFDHSAIAEQAAKFDVSAFRRNIQSYVKECLKRERD